MTSPEIVITNPDNMPLGELLQPQADGAPVQRSAHVGNQFGADLILTALGCRMIMVDLNYGARDQLYFPQLIVDESHEPVTIACSQTLSAFNRAGVDQSLSDFHNGSLLEAFGNDRVESETGYLQSNQGIYEEALALFTKSNPELFRRQVDENGMPMPFRALSDLRVDQLSVFNSASAAGVIIPNEINIVVNFVAEALNFGTDTIVHISGPTMFRYMQEMREVCDHLYGLLRDNASFGNQLPEQLNVRLVPAAGVRFVVRQGLQPALDDLLAAFDEFEALALARADEGRRIQAMDMSRSDKNAAFQAANIPSNRQEAIVRGLFEPVQNMFFVRDGTSNFPLFTSQYSALRDGANGTPGSGLYIPDFVLERPLREVSQRFERLEKLYNKGRRK